MSHVDEGRLHAYLDGELGAVGADAAEVRSHLAGCEECRRRLDEASRVRTRAAALLGDASPPESIVPPFDSVVGRAALAPREGVHHTMEGSQMTTTADAEVLFKPRFNHLVASGGHKKRAWNSRTALVSLVLHSGLIIGAVYATVRAPEEAVSEQELVEFMEIEETKPEPEAPKPEEPQPEPEEVQGTQTLEPPTEPPPAIPAVDLSAPAVSAEDFSGIGTLGGVADAPPAPAPEPEPEPEFAYELAVLERQPALSNQGTIASVMERLYPRILQDAGIGGTVVMQFVIEPDGTVDMSSVKVIDSPHEQLSDASIKAVERFRFRPGRYKGENVRVLIQMPITWQPAG